MTFIGLPISSDYQNSQVLQKSCLEDSWAKEGINWKTGIFQPRFLEYLGIWGKLPEATLDIHQPIYYQLKLNQLWNCETHGLVLTPCWSRKRIVKGKVKFVMCSRDSLEN
jgi:hypothetical protein